MAVLKGKSLFFTTSPRTPLKMIPEITLINEKFVGKKWTNQTQVDFMEELIKDQRFELVKKQKDPAFSARDRINRSPKALGFIDLKPELKVTKPGEKFINNVRVEETLLRQLLKFQLPSPYHTISKSNTTKFYIKPYLEIIRLVSVLDNLSFDEMAIFGLQLVNYHEFDQIVNKIKQFRSDKEANKGNYKKLYRETFINELSDIYQEEIEQGNLKTRESKDISIKNFMNTKMANCRDYTDACFRYLRSTGLLSVSFKGRSLTISKDKIDDVEFILNTVERNPVFINDENGYKKYLFNENLPILFTDNRDNVINYLLKYGDKTLNDLKDLSISELKDVKDIVVQSNREKIISKQVTALKSYSVYSEVIDTYNEIISDNLYDIPLMLEWNTWRAMTMLNGGVITGNFKVDDNGEPMSTAVGNTPDISCDYGSFGLTVEVTMQSGQRQYEAEGEPVARHLAKFKKEIGKDAYCIFIAPKVNEATIAHFYALSKINISYYGGKLVIIPLSLDIFMKMIENSYSSKKTPRPNDILSLCKYAENRSIVTKNEHEWFMDIQTYAINWFL